MSIRLRNNVGALMREFLVDHRGAGELRQGPRWSGFVRWPVSARLSWSLATVTLVLAAATMVTAVTDGDLFIISLVPGPVAAALIGGLVTVRRPDQPLGILLCAYGLCGAVCASAFGYAHAAVVRFPGTLPAGTPMMWVTSWDYVPVMTLQALVLPLVFPDGRLLSRRWRPALWAAVTFVPLAVIGNAFDQESMGGWFSDRPNPYAVQGSLFRVILDVGGACGLAAAVAAAVGVVLRWHRSGHVVRQQLKWIFATVPVTAAVAMIVQFFPDALIPGLVLGSLSSLLTAVAIGLAVLRYRLYGIDIVISRAAVYGLLSAAVAGLYLAVTGAAGGLSEVGGAPSMQVLVTVTAAAVLLPVRGRLQRRVDRLFFGDRGTPYAAMARLGRQVEVATSAEPVLSSVVSVVASSLRLPYAAVQLRLGDGWIPGADWGQALAEVVAFPLTFQRETVGRLLVGQRAPEERLGPDDERLLANLARQIAPAAHAVMLRKALDTSRVKLVSAREEERRRLRRDLHDELGPAVAALTLGLDTACVMAAGHRDLGELLSRLKAESQHAVTDIRRIVYGLRPPALDELGLAEALREQVAWLELQAAGLSAIVHIPGECLDGLSAAAEVAVFRIVTEAVTNVVRHAQARFCEICISVSGHLSVEICDDGVGMPEGWRAGVGITAMRERAAELGGEMRIEPGRPRGTRIIASLPIGGRNEFAHPGAHRR